MVRILGVLLALAVFGALVYYVWRRLVRDTGLSGAARVAATIALCALVLPVLGSVLLGGGGPPNLRGAIAWPAFLGWAAFLLMFGGLVAVDAGRAIAWAARRLARLGRRPAARAQPVDPSRRQALARLAGGAVTAVAAAKVGIGVREALAGAEIVTEEFTLARLPRALDGFTFVQITDLHVGMTIGKEFVSAMVERVNALGGDAIVLTGDLVDGSVAALGDAVSPLGDLRAPAGVYSVTGNHEYFSGADPWIAFLGRLGIPTLRNERVEIARGGAAFDLAGIDDHNARGPGHGPDLAKALAGRDQSRALVLLAHQPRQVRMATRFDVDLQISGHTHGGQVWPWHYLASIQQRGLLAGRYLIGDTQLYVSRGVGHWGPPMRVLAPAELTRIVLRAPR